MRSLSLGALAACLLLTACGPGDPVAAVPINGSGGSGGGGTGTAGGGSVGGVAILSHNAGQDCMSCHKTGGTGRGVFTVAGTVYRSGGGAQTAATVMIYPQGSTTAQATMTVDGLGNFWTTQTVAALVPAAGQTLVQGVRAVDPAHGRHVGGHARRDQQWFVQCVPLASRWHGTRDRAVRGRGHGQRACGSGNHRRRRRARGSRAAVIDAHHWRASPPRATTAA